MSDGTNSATANTTTTVQQSFTHAPRSAQPVMTSSTWRRGGDDVTELQRARAESSPTQRQSTYVYSRGVVLKKEVGDA